MTEYTKYKLWTGGIKEHKTKRIAAVTCYHAGMQYNARSNMTRLPGDVCIIDSPHNMPRNLKCNVWGIETQRVGSVVFLKHNLSSLHFFWQYQHRTSSVSRQWRDMKWWMRGTGFGALPIFTHEHMLGENGATAADITGRTEKCFFFLPQISFLYMKIWKWWCLVIINDVHCY